jgi:nucleoside-diphosphate-sugar epimerase
MVKKILITGNNGTIGTRLCEKLMDSGYEVVGIDWQKNKWQPKVDQITVIGDLRDPQALEQLSTDFDLVIHLAANARVYNLVKEPRLARDNFETLFNVLEFCRKANIKRFIFASSREVYGNSEKMIHNEEEAYVKNCESPYTASKIGGESLVHSYQQCYGIDFTILRFSNVYGMYDESDRLIPLFMRLCNDNKDLTVFGKDKLLDFTYIDDNIEGIMLCIKKFDNIKNDVFNVAQGQGTTILEVAQLVKTSMNKNVKILLEDNRTGEVVKYIADISKAKTKLGYEPKINIAEGVKRSIAWFNANNENSNTN